MQLRESGEMYLETIYFLSKKCGFVRAIDICREMGYSKPSVSHAMKLLNSKGYIVVEDDGNILLTPNGKEIAEKISERHITLTNFFISIGVDAETAENDACKFEHYISDNTYNAIKKHLGI